MSFFRALILVSIASFSHSVSSRDRYYEWWLEEYAARSQSGEASCQLCHQRTSGGDGWNAYGWDLRQVFASNRAAIGGNFENEEEALRFSLQVLEPFKTDLNKPTTNTYLNEIESDAQPGWRDSPDNRISFKDDTFELLVAPENLSCLTRIDASSVLEPCPLIDPVLENIGNQDLSLELSLITSGFSNVVSIVHSEALKDSLFVVERSGQIWEINLITKSKELFLDFSRLLLEFNLDKNDERGLLGFAFHPMYSENNIVITYMSRTYQAGLSHFPVKFEGDSPNHLSIVSQWIVTDESTTAPALSTGEVTLIAIERSNLSPNGGDVNFGSDGHLYIAVGDEVKSNIITALEDHQEDVFGSILRIDIDSFNPSNGRYSTPSTNPNFGAESPEELYATGFRFPTSLSFNTSNQDDSNDLYLSDKGLNFIQEVNLITPSNKPNNFGWNYKEGPFFRYLTDTQEEFISSVAPLEATRIMFNDPIALYDEDEGRSIVGGVVYQGRDIPKLANRYLFGDNKAGTFENESRLFYLEDDFKIIEIGKSLLSDKELQVIGDGVDGTLFIIADDKKSDITGGLFQITAIENETCYVSKTKSEQFFTICI